MTVSIPQSEFCPLGRQTDSRLRGWVLEFQFLSRNSVRWDIRTRMDLHRRYKVSIPQSEFCPLGLPWCTWGSGRIACRFNSSVGILSVGTGAGGAASVGGWPVSIPQSEFCPLGRRYRTRNWRSCSRFQFLSRNSVRWDCWPWWRSRPRCRWVSIPQSEFCPLGPDGDVPIRSDGQPVSIPQSEFCPLGPGLCGHPVH